MSTPPNKLLSNDDMALCVAYVDGALARDAQVEFELRMAAEPNIAAATQALLETDEMLRELHAGTQRKLARIHKLRPWIWAASLAAAAAILFLFGRELLVQRTKPSFEVALAPSFESPLDYIASRPELAGLRPPGLDLMRGDNTPPNVDATEFVAKASAAEPRVSKADRVEAGYFVVPISLAEGSTVIVVAFSSNKPAGTLLWPAAADARPAAQLGRLAAGQHVLPETRFTLEHRSDGASAVSYHRGFLVPVGCGKLDVVCAVRAAPLTDGDRASLERVVAAGADEFGDWLESCGFERADLSVTEPAH